MQKEIANYCLQAMGIVPWVLRKPATDDTPVISMSEADLNAAEAKLLEQMLKTIGLDSASVSIQAASNEACTLLHPRELLNNPLLKRKAYAMLGLIKQQFGVHVSS